jgi:hypothetical protein
MHVTAFMYVALLGRSSLGHKDTLGYSTVHNVQSYQFRSTHHSQRQHISVLWYLPNRV